MNNLWTREPVVFLGLIQAAITLIVTFGVTLTPEQTGAILAFSTAVFTFIARSQVSPVDPSTGKLRYQPPKDSK